MEGRKWPVRPRSPPWRLQAALWAGESMPSCGGVSGGGRWRKMQMERGPGHCSGWPCLGTVGGVAQRPEAEVPPGAATLPCLGSRLSLPCRPRHQRCPGALQHRHQHPGGVYQQGGCLRPVSGPRTASTCHLGGVRAPPLKAAIGLFPATDPLCLCPLGGGPGRSWGPGWR